MADELVLTVPKELEGKALKLTFAKARPVVEAATGTEVLQAFYDFNADRDPEHGFGNFEDGVRWAEKRLGVTE